MSRLYNLIEEQILNLISAFTFVDSNDEVVFFGMNLKVNRPLVNFFIKLISAMIYLGFALYFGTMLWNQGLSAVMPNVISPIGVVGVVPQLRSQYMQLMITLVALMFIM